MGSKSGAKDKMQIFFYVHGSVHRESMSIIVQQDATMYSCIIFSADSSTCFGLYPHPSSGAHSNCNYNIWHWSNRFCYRLCQQMVANTSCWKII